LELSKKDL
jgi:hypothetical protein